jgi:hypothetical protein
MRLRGRERVSTAVSEWLPNNLAFVEVQNATSDVVTNIGGQDYRVVTWQSSGLIKTSRPLAVEYLMVGGGGGSGGAASGTDQAVVVVVVV